MTRAWLLFFGSGSKLTCQLAFDPREIHDLCPVCRSSFQLCTRVISTLFKALTLETCLHRLPRLYRSGNGTARIPGFHFKKLRLR